MQFPHLCIQSVRRGIAALVSGCCLVLVLSPAVAADPMAPHARLGDQWLTDYFRHQTARLSTACLADVQALPDWTERRDQYRRQLYEMLGLDPLPQRTPLQPVVTGTLDHPQFTVEKLAFQSRPGLYVTANLYVPKGLTRPAPAVLYVCGHGNVVKDGVSYGSKAKYQHHAAWFARHGFVSLIIDTLELGEIPGEHHGTYSKNRWWWNARGYTPAGVEAWNGIRAIDYLQSRKEVDPERIGVTGRSGGGAYSWWIAGLDERVKSVVPVAGMTDLENHVVDGCVEGHCDCMYLVNTYRWDYAQVAALVAPRQLLLANTDADRIFPLDGVERIDNHLRRLYALYGAPQSLGLQISPGGHKDLQELQVAALHWFNRTLKHEEPLIADAAVPLFEPEALKVFDAGQVPKDALNSRIDETFVALAPPPTVPRSATQWLAQRAAWREALEKKVFAGWPEDAGGLNLKQTRRAAQAGFELAVYEFASQPDMRLRLHVLRPLGVERPAETILNICGQSGWDEWLAMAGAAFAEQLADEAPVQPSDALASLELLTTATRRQIAFFAPRGVGRSAWNPDPKKQTQIRRRFMLLGQTLEGMQAWDVRRAIQALRSLPNQPGVPITLVGSGPSAGLALYASLFEPPVAELQLSRLPRSHRENPNFLNILRYLDMPAAVAMVAERSRITLAEVSADDWEYPLAVARRLGWGSEQLEFESAD